MDRKSPVGPIISFGGMPMSTDGCVVPHTAALAHIVNLELVCNWTQIRGT